MKSIFTKWTLLGALLFVSQIVMAQKVSGKVTDQANEALVGVSVVQKGTSNGTVTDIDGNFSLDVKGNTTLVFSYVGYESVEMATTGGTLNVTLKEGAARLEEVVVTGLASNIKRSNASNSVARISGEELTGRTRAPTLDGAMSGKLAGANIVSNSGAPGGGMSIKLRGISSVVLSSEPLYVIDGIIVDNSQFATGAGTRAFNGAVSAANSGSQDQATNRISDINPADIESIDVLKGPSASAIYGSRANAGVIVITTKRGKAGKTTVRLSQDFGASRALNLLESEDWTTAKIEKFGGVYGVDKATALKLFNDSKGQTIDLDKEMFGETGRLINTNINVSGGNDKTRFFISGGLNDETGIVQKTYFKRYSLRANIDHNITDRINVKISSAYFNTSNARSFLGNDNNGVSLGYSIAYIPNFVNLRPTTVDGKTVYPAWDGTGQNPYEIRDRMENKEYTDRFLQSADVNFNLLQKENFNLKLAVKGGVDYLHSQPRVYAPEDLQYQKIRANPGASRFANNKAFNTYLQSFLTAGWSLAGIDMTSQLGLLRFDRKTDQSWIQGEGLQPGQRNPSTAQVRIVDQFLSKTQDVAFDVSQDFNWQDKIVGRVGLRADKSSLNADNEKLYYFPRASLAVNVANFDFLKDNSFISQLKPRVAFGRSGGVPAYGDIYSTLVGVVYDGKLGAVSPTVNGNGDLGPETAQELELGIDFGFLKNRISVEATYYDKRILDFLFAFPLSSSTGVTQLARFNVGDMSNRGIEVGINADVVRSSSLKWSTGIQIWNNKTRIDRLIIVPTFAGSGFGAFGRNRLVEGMSPSLWWGRDAQGNTPVQFGRDAQPKYQLSWSNNLTIAKNLEFSMLWHTSQGNYNSSLTRELKDEGGTTYDWSQETVEKGVPNGLSSRLFGNPGYTTENFVLDASYIRMREISLYYTIPNVKSMTNNKVSNIRVGVSGQNLLTFSPYLKMSYDPESSNFGNQAFGASVDLSPFPSAKRMFAHIILDF
jgi:TonB-linked SusC/RagA family outer membrane protein